MKLKHLVRSLVLLLFIASCAPKKKLVYFQGVDALEEVENTNYSPKIKPDDQLSIAVNSLDPSAAIPFNNFQPTLGVNAANVDLLPYLVAKDGTIDFPQLGSLKVAGLTRLELMELLKQRLEPFLVQPTVNIQILNFTVTILGEVKAPGAYKIDKERISILDAVGLAGDLTVHGMRNNVLVIREHQEEKEFVRVDLTAANLFESPMYYLQQNDVVYVEPNKPKVNSSATSAATGVWISITSLTIAIITLITK
ncbi:polysaccharide biosynthesis/export family protein [Flavicella marina]|uniref:polysaccharide biosynthesis/export family protein n=1 Tax=Flavicella marina TaxID=1475951 RepID=UPI001D00E538|nr:polysaccharide biosynthesis/export family protein [Flavicella marina]